MGTASGSSRARSTTRDTGGAAANNTFADITVVDNEGSGVLPQTLYYTQAVLVVRPSTGLAPGSPITASAFGDAPGVLGVLVEINPLLAYIEDPNSLPGGPPPYADLITVGFTDAGGNATVPAVLPTPSTPPARRSTPTTPALRTRPRPPTTWGTATTPPCADPNREKLRKHLAL